MSVKVFQKRPWLGVFDKQAFDLTGLRLRPDYDHHDDDGRDHDDAQAWSGAR